MDRIKWVCNRNRDR